MKIVIAAGGSGGHIYPALSLAEALKEKGHEPVFIGSNDRMEKDVIPDRGFEYIGLDVLTTRGGILQKIRSIFSMVSAYHKCLKLLQGFDMAIGFGNYISVPVMEAARKLGLKTVIHEQNSFVGRANRMLDRQVDLVIGSYPENLKQFKNPHIRILGNPQSSRAYDLPKDPNVIKELGLDPSLKTVAIFMGSLGSSSVNARLQDYFDRFDGSYQIVYATGRSHYDEVPERFKHQDKLKIFETIDGVRVMNNADLVICRAGATTLAEIAAIGIASILIPSPYVPNNHQYYNGKALVDQGVAIMIEEKDLNGELLNDTVNGLIHDEERLHVMGENAQKTGNPHVLSDMIEEIESL